MLSLSRVLSVVRFVSTAFGVWVVSHISDDGLSLVRGTIRSVYIPPVPLEEQCRPCYLPNNYLIARCCREGSVSPSVLPSGRCILRCLASVAREKANRFPSVYVNVRRPVPSNAHKIMSLPLVRATLLSLRRERTFHAGHCFLFKKACF